MLSISNKDFEEKVDSMSVVQQDMTLNEFAVLQLHVKEVCYVLIKSTFI